MRSLEKPNLDSVDVFKKCISNFTDTQFKDRLNTCEKEVRVYSKLFDRRVKKNMIYKFNPSNNINGKVTSEEMKKVYTQKLVNKNGPGRVIYDKIRNAPAHGICPLCGQRIVSTLDHYLSKMKHPALAVTPINLIPACSDCNKTKSDIQPTKGEEQTLHPYYDNLDDDEWLFADIIESNPISVKFYVNAPEKWDSLLSARVKNHIRTFKLEKLYISHAGAEIASISYKLKKLYHTSGEASVRAALLEEFESRKSVCKNTWQVALYRALANSDWYCCNGVLL